MATESSRKSGVRLRDHLGRARCTEPNRMRDGRWFFWDRKLDAPVEGFATREEARVARRERRSW